MKQLVRPAITALLLSVAPVDVAAQDIPDGRVAHPGHHPGMTHAMEDRDSPMLAFSVTEQVRSTPDRASISAGVTTTAPTAVEAIRQNAARIDAMIATLRRTGIEAADIQTSGFSLAPQYDYRPQERGQPPLLTGYQVVNQLTATTRDVRRIGALIDALVEAGGTNIGTPEFSVANPDAALDEARTNAMRTATERANAFARAAGYARARLISINEGGGFFQPMPLMMARADANVGGNAIQPGQVSNGITLSLQYRLER